jgi:hypothetical protein
MPYTVKEWIVRPTHRGITRVRWRQVEGKFSTTSKIGYRSRTEPWYSECPIPAESMSRVRLPLAVDKSEGVVKDKNVLSGVCDTACSPEKVEDQAPGISR